MLKAVDLFVLIIDQSSAQSRLAVIRKTLQKAKMGFNVI